MARLGSALAALCCLMALALQASAETHRLPLNEATIGKAVDNFVEFLHEQGEKIVADKPDGLLARVLSAGSSNKRRLMTLSGVADRFGERMQTVQEFFEGILGLRWRELVPADWALPSFDWSHLGEFEYGSNLGDFMDAHDLKNLTNINSMHDLAHSMKEIELAFCEEESFTPSEKVPASCTGPSVTIALVPKVCILESKTKQILCDPAKLVLTKTPGACVHKYKSASAWVGKECKIAGGAGWADSTVIGGGERSLPLLDVDIGLEL